MPPLASQDRAPAIDTHYVSATEFRGALSHLATTVSVLTTNGPAGVSGVTCSAVCAASDEPAILLACVHGKSAANAAIKANGVFCVNCLQTAQSNLSQAFAGIGSIPIQERFALSDWDVLVSGAPHCKDALVALDCEIIDVRGLGTHSIFIAKVLAISETGGEPLLYRRHGYVTTRTL